MKYKLSEYRLSKKGIVTHYQKHKQSLERLQEYLVCSGIPLVVGLTMVLDIAEDKAEVESMLKRLIEFYNCTVEE